MALALAIALAFVIWRWRVTTIELKEAVAREHALTDQMHDAVEHLEIANETTDRTIALLHEVERARDEAQAELNRWKPADQRLVDTLAKGF